LNLPDYNFVEKNEDDFPLGWFLNYSNIFEVAFSYYLLCKKDMLTYKIIRKKRKFTK